MKGTFSPEVRDCLVGSCGSKGLTSSTNHLLCSTFVPRVLKLGERKSCLSFRKIDALTVHGSLNLMFLFYFSFPFVLQLVS